MTEVVVIAETVAGLPAPVTIELVEFAKHLRVDQTIPVRILVLGDDIERSVTALSVLSDTAVTGFPGVSLAAYNAEAWKDILAPHLAGINPRFICVAHNANGADFAPGLAVRLKAGCITAVEEARQEGGTTVFRRSVLNGKIKADVVPCAETTVVTLLPGTFRGADAGATAIGAVPDQPTGMVVSTGNTEIIPIDALLLQSRSLGLLSAPEKDADLTAAEVVVSAGRGIEKEENLILIRDLAALFSRSAVGASRTVCDAGWLPHRLQIGQTGKTVTPRLYIACGISGALQHLVGMRGSQFVVAINSDPHAAIFQAADVCVVENLLSFLPLLIDACKRHNKEGATV